jgi:hypothetical protein
MIVVTPAALEVLRMASAAAVRFNPEAKVRIRRVGSGVGFELADEIEATDQRVVAGSFVLLAEAGIAGTVDVAEHNELVLLAP